MSSGNECHGDEDEIEAEQSELRERKHEIEEDFYNDRGVEHE